MRFGTWNVSSLYSALTAAARELVRYKLDLVGVQEVRWDRGGTVRAGNYFFSMGNETINWKQDFFVCHRIVLAESRVC
jgi:exonuclease III